MAKITVNLTHIKALGVDIAERPKILFTDNQEFEILKGDYEDILRACLLTGEFKSITHSHYKEVYLRTTNNKLN